jgi:hypothetical protein
MGWEGSRRVQLSTLPTWAGAISRIWPSIAVHVFNLSAPSHKCQYDSLTCNAKIFHRIRRTKSTPNLSQLLAHCSNIQSWARDSSCALLIHLFLLRLNTSRAARPLACTHEFWLKERSKNSKLPCLGLKKKKITGNRFLPIISAAVCPRTIFSAIKFAVSR